MQFHLNGFRPGDPSVSDPLDHAARGPDLPDTTDVLIVGCGPAGLTLAAQMSAFKDIQTVIVDQKPGPLQLGQADGVAVRSMEMFQAFGFADRLMKEAYWVNEVTFWKPLPDDPRVITRTGRAQDTEDGLSEFPHVILNQARVHDFYLYVMRRSASRAEPYYSRQLTELTTNRAAEYPVCATFTNQDTGQTETIRAKYAVGCDGARSAVRQAIGQKLEGDSDNVAWGVMDVLAVTDFPDIRFKSLIQSETEGSIVLIPREGGYLARFYIEMDKLRRDERVSHRNITVDQLIAAANRILHPYVLDVKEVAWWSVYEIGQRLCPKFDNGTPEHLPNVFIAGDACHTHSPKAGQGMNVSMSDSFNLGWKLAGVLRGQYPRDLLQTYSQERQAVAQMLIDFDREWARVIAGKADMADGTFDDYFVRHLRYTAGTTIQYRPSRLTDDDTHQALAAGYQIGTRFHSAPVVRAADARRMELGHVAQADGRWRLYAFGGEGDTGAPGTPMAALCDWLMQDPGSPNDQYGAPGADPDALIDLRAVFRQGHAELDTSQLPALLIPAKGKLGLRDYEKVFCPDHTADETIFDLRGITPSGCMVLVRPDQHIAMLAPLEGTARLGAFFDGIMQVRG